MRAAFYTFGCKVNQYETQSLAGAFAAAGFEIGGVKDDCDVYVINSCTVTAEGDAKVRKLMRRLRREHPGALLALTGCYAQAFPDIAALAPEADVITGANNRAALLPAVRRALETRRRVIDVAPHVRGEAFEQMTARSFAGPSGQARTRAFVKIQDGCERRCAYCIIPAARGPVRSRALEDLSRELEDLAARGYREAVLAGINLSCYGTDTGLRLTDAVDAACAVPGIERVRLSSLEPELIGPADLDAMRRQPKFCPHFHLSLQSGCDRTLRRMRRPYTAAQYAALAEDIRRRFDNPAVTTDIMVGFPGETEADFLESLRFCEAAGFARAHVFAYSRRPGTEADAMPDQIPAREKARRSRLMIRAMDAARARFLEGQSGRECRVLFEQPAGPELYTGYSENYTAVRVRCARALTGEILPVRLTGVQDGACLGSLAE